MERLRGCTLRDELRRRGHLPVEEALDLCADLLAGLEAAHGAGVIHRDIKPANLFLCEPTGPCRQDGGARRTLKILDFGLAKVIAAENAEAPSRLALATANGTTLGTPRFLAPEQALDGAVDARTDLYAVGAVLYTLLVGHDPFAHVRGFAELCRAQAAEAPQAPARVAPQPIGDALDAVILKALAKRPEDRFHDAAALAAALASTRSSKAHEATIAGSAPPAPLVTLSAAAAIVAASVLASLLATIALVRFLGAGAPPVEYRFSGARANWYAPAGGR
jgi:serine/threonine-protein kinase